MNPAEQCRPNWLRASVSLCMWILASLASSVGFQPTLGASLCLWILASLATANEPPPEVARWFAPQAWQRDTAGPIVSLGKDGDFDDRHIFAPAIIQENGRFSLWYSGSQGTPGNRVFRLGLATSKDGREFQNHGAKPVLAFADQAHSVLTPAPLRSADGSVLRENGKLRMWFSSAKLGKSGLHTLHESHSSDGIQWDEPSPALQEHVYCPTILKTGDTYQMWYSDVSRRPWVLRHATSSDGHRWTADERPALVLSQPWEAEVLVYPTVLMVEDVYLMWYGSYDQAIRRQTTAIGFAASSDGKTWYKHPQNPVLRPDPARPWESNYVGSGSVLRLPDGSFRYYYASRKAPPFLNLYFAINTARWPGPPPMAAAIVLHLPPVRGDRGLLVTDASLGRSLEVLEVIDDLNAIVRAWYVPPTNADAPAASQDATFVDIWLRGIATQTLNAGAPIKLPQTFTVIGNELIDTTCGKRSFVVLEAAKE